MIFAMPGIDGTDYTMRIFNSDGSEPEVRPRFHFTTCFGSALFNSGILLFNFVF